MIPALDHRLLEKNIREKAAYKHRESFLHRSGEAGNFKVKMAADSVSGEDLLPGL